MPPKMPNKITLRGQEARDAALRGIEVVYDMVSATLGPRSANIAIARPYGRPAVVHDGVTVAKEVLPLADPFENVGAELAVESADRTNAIGDGTTTSTVLMRNIAKSAHTYITAGAKPMALREGIEAAVSAVVSELNDLATPVEVKDDAEKSISNVSRIATVSAQDEFIGSMVADAYKELGAEGIMSVEETRATDSYLEIKTGMEFDRGYKSPVFITDQSLKEATVTDAYVLVTDYPIRSVEQFAPLMEKLLGEGVKNIVIIATEVEGEALAFLAVNKHKGNLNCLAVQAPGFGPKRLEMLQDIAIVTNGTLVSHDSGISLESVNKSYLGHAGRITATEHTTLILDGAGAEEDVVARAEALKEQAASPDTGEYDAEKLMERYAKLKSGVAVLHIGARSEPELKEQKERAIDAISAAKAALSEGIVPGGGIALAIASLRAAKRLAKDVRKGHRDFDAGVALVIEACRQPFNKLLENAGFDPGEKWADVKLRDAGFGVNVMTGEIVDMIDAGIIDPVLVVKSALQNASSNAVMIATTDGIIAYEAQEK